MPALQTFGPSHSPATESVNPPAQPWRWSQTWQNVFFSHWKVPGEALYPHLPPCLDIDLWEASAWISVVAFRLHVRLRWLPIPVRLVEINLRTYVRWRGEAGIYFLSIHAGHRAAVTLARILTPLPYAHAPIVYDDLGDERRLTCRCPSSDNPLFDVEFSPSPPSAKSPSGSLYGWLLERYRAFVPDRRGNIYRMEVQHAPWLVQKVETHVNANNLAAPWGLDLTRQPDAGHFCSWMPAVVWPFEKVQDGLA